MASSAKAIIDRARTVLASKEADLGVCADVREAEVLIGGAAKLQFEHAVENLLKVAHSIFIRLILFS
jgi:hypothetical protein